ncbi:MAG: glucosyl transferase [Ignavibacteriaceae bacterium]|nr:glucosyl transferase [Ignavibacteriaceae bacterium]
MYKLFIFFFLPLIAINSCKTVNPLIPEPKISLSVEDALCTEAWLNLKTSDVSLPVNVILQVNNTVFKKFSLLTPDSTIYLDSLLPGKNYLFKASIALGNSTYSSDNVSALTMDTTSNNITWQKFQFGDFPSNILFDVAVIDENNIWAGGEIHLLDSTGQRDDKPYNAVHWNGTKWEVLRIPTRIYTGEILYAIIKAIYAFNKDDIWAFSDAGSFSHWDGKEWKSEFVWERKGGGNRFWGTSSTDLYLACSNGGLSYYNGAKWTLINTGTDLNINDIYGSWNEQTGRYDIMAVASNILESLERKILQISGNTVTNVNSDTLNTTLSSVWFKPNKKYYVVGGGIYQKNNLNEDVWKNKHLEFTHYFTYSIIGTDVNDLIAVGAYGEVLHYNGSTWKSFMDETGIDGGLYSVRIKNNLIVAVGEESTKGVLFIGRR